MTKKGYKLKEEHKKKISLALKGRVISMGMTGKHHSEETKQKISNSEKGKIVSEETRKKLSKISLGKKYGLETIQKRIESRKNNGRPWHSEESKKKIGVANKGNIPWSYIDGRSYNKSPHRYGDDWEAIRMLVYLRDKFTCQNCGKTMEENGRALNIHHKVPFLISFDNSLKNLITLCCSCHTREEVKITKLIKQKMFQTE